MRYWLFKSEPDDYSISDLQLAGEQGTCWFGIRNYQARNFLRDELQVGDLVLFYHSSCKQPAIVGTAVVTKTAYPDPSATDPQSPYFDAKSTEAQPRWFSVDIQWQSTFYQPVTLSFMKQHPPLAQMYLIQKGSRLSLQPVTAEEWNIINKLGVNG
ncbi:EVE domain-containing protein [Shewanella avicenniae]|uniref:EVE domain-containing protein n=1 Tax=Shewanella avicenniae TaxID=2814294 RepID=A0ABX7QU41_9GAMM|nr:EVE domain-containing protein [Shewanella avicenniae]QSX35013.1 EVE domain-containing protein [Shewanella avicenniae]